MEPVDGVTQAMEILRRQMAENLDGLKRTGKDPSRVATRPTVGSSAMSPSIPEIVARKIRTMDPLAPDFDQQASSVYIESVLIAEFGDRLVNNPAFHDMLSAVQKTMLSDETIRIQLQSLLRGLRAS